MLCVKSFFLLGLFISGSPILFSQPDLPPNWRAFLIREDSNTIVFRLASAIENGKKVFYIRNAEERIRIDEVSEIGDSVFFHMPVFESSLRAKKQMDGSLTGIWTKGTEEEDLSWLFRAIPDRPYRFPLNGGNANQNISGKWDVTFIRSDGTPRKALAIFEQSGNTLTGTFLTPTGDYRYLEGIVTGDSLLLSTFDGAHAYSFYARIENRDLITSGLFITGFYGKETWTAVKTDEMHTPIVDAPTRLREGESRLHFTFNDLEGRPVSINDKRFRNKVVIIQILGSWCPNCMDETRFLSEYYNKNRNRGVEVIGLAYEYSTDLERSRKSLRRFQEKFNVQYPMLITGVSVADEKRTEKTLPEITPIRAFPTTLFLDKKGNVREIHNTFYGQGTGEYFEIYKTKFYSAVDRLLNEN